MKEIHLKEEKLCWIVGGSLDTCKLTIVASFSFFGNSVPIVGHGRLEGAKSSFMGFLGLQQMNANVGCCSCREERLLFMRVCKK